MKEKLPDSFVPDRRLKEYPTEIGSQNFSPENLELFKMEKTAKVKHYYSKKIEDLSKEYNSLLREISVNEMLYSSKISFEPVVGKTYFLYNKANGKFLSMISPDEWNNSPEFIGKFQLQTDGRWTEV